MKCSEWDRLLFLIQKILDDENDKVPFELFLIADMKSIKNLDLEYSDAMDKLMFDINKRISLTFIEYGHYSNL